jgi:F1F0 ATPase subunit 2
MYDYLGLLLVFGFGLLLGAIFFGGLWWTVRKGISSKQPGLLFLGSMLLRTGVVLFGFYLVAGNQSVRLVICLLGFACMRFIISRFTRPPLQPYQAEKLGDSHAP